MRIDVSGDKTAARNFQEYFRADGDGNFQTFTPVESGNFSMSYGLWKTAFVASREDEGSPLFDELLDNRKIIAERLAYDNPQWVAEGEHVFYDSIGQGIFPFGYTSISQEVLFYSFLAAYSGDDARTIALNPFPSIPIPNWSVTYNGLTEIPFISRMFRAVNLNHAYRSSYNVSTWRTNVDYDPDNRTRTFANSNVFISRFEIAQLSITEQFSPLLGVDITMHNSFSVRVEYKKQRNLTMSFVNNQLTEVEGNEIITGFGYRIRNLALVISNITGGGRISRSTSDLVLKLDLGFRKDKTTLRRIDERYSQVSAGQNRVNIYFTADYMLNDRFNLQAFFKRDVSDPFVSNQFRNSTTFAGVTMRFSLAQ
jgi:cell surface protein SprA